MFRLKRSFDSNANISFFVEKQKYRNGELHCLLLRRFVIYFLQNITEVINFFLCISDTDNKE